MNTNTAKVIEFTEYESVEQKHINKINRRLELSLSKTSVASYNRELKKFFKISDISNITFDMLNSITSDDVVNYLQPYIESKKSKSYVNKIRNSISTYYKNSISYSEEYKLENGITFNPANAQYIKDMIKRNTETKASKLNLDNIEMLTMDMAKDYIQAIKITDIDNPKLRDRNILAIKLGCLSGLRRVGIVNLQIKNILTYKKDGKTFYYLNIEASKGNKTRLVNIGKQLHNDIMEFADRWSLEDESYIIGKGMFNLEQVKEGTINQQMNKYSKLVDKPLHPHQLRSIFAGEFIKNGSVQDLQEVLGHSDEKTTREYLENCGITIKKTNFVEM